MIFRRSNVRAAITLLGLLVPVAVRAQEQPPAQPQSSAAQAPAASAPSASQTAPPASQPVPPRRQTAPDYPDPRTFTVGLFYWGFTPQPSPNLIGGKQAPDYETLDGLGNAKMGPGAEFYFPITRTGELHAIYFQTTGDGSQTATQAVDLFSNPFAQGDYLTTRYLIRGGKFYLDDLLYPHKFPVAKFRLKEMWEVTYVGIKSTISAPLAPTVDQNGNTVITTVDGSRQIVLPEFGIAAEYAIAPHILLRAEMSGFGLVHKANIWDGAGTIAFRHNQWEIAAGAKAFHFKTSPNNTEYLVGTLSGAFVEFRWHL